MASGTRPHPATAPPPLRWASASVSHGCSIPDRTEGRAGWEGQVSEATQSAFPPQGPDSHITTSGCRRGLGKALCILDGHVCKNQGFHYRVIKGGWIQGFNSQRLPPRDWNRRVGCHRAVLGAATRATAVQLVGLMMFKHACHLHIPIKQSA